MSFKGYKIDVIDIKNKPKGEPVFFRAAYSNINIVAKKNQGKTLLIYNLLRNIVGPDTKIYIFCNTVERDATWKQIVNELKDKGNEVEAYDSMYERIKLGKRSKTINILEKLLNEWKKENVDKPNENKKSKKKKDKEEQKGDGRSRRIKTPYDRNITWDMLEDDDVAQYLFKCQRGICKEIKEEEVIEEVKPKRRTKKLYPEKILICDDLSNEIKDPIIPTILKQNRHMKMLSIISSQDSRDIKPDSRGQFNQIFTFKGLEPARVEVIRKMCDIALDEKEFYDLYKKTTEDPYAFLYCDVDYGEIYKNFDTKVFS